MLILKILAQLKRLVKFMINTKLKVGFFKKRNGAQLDNRGCEENEDKRGYRLTDEGKIQKENSTVSTLRQNRYQTEPSGRIWC